MDGVFLVWINLGYGSLHLRGTPASALSGGPITATAVSRCGSFALTGHVAGGIHLWHLASHAHEARHHFVDARSAAGLSTAERIAGEEAPAASAASAAASKGGAIAGSLSLTKPLEPLCSSYLSASRTGCAVWALCFNPLAPGIFASGGRDGCAYIWNTGLSEPQRVCAGHGGDVTCLAWHENGLYLVTGSSDGTARLWDASPQTGIDCLRLFNPAGSRTLSASGSSSSSAGGNLAVSVAFASSLAAPGVTCLALCRGGRFLALGDEQGTVSLWDIPSGAPIATWPLHLRIQQQGSEAQSLSPVHSLCFSGMGRFLLAGVSSGSGVGSGANTIVYTWDAAKAVEAWEGKRSTAEAAPQNPLVSLVKIPGVTSFHMLSDSSASSHGPSDVTLIGAKL